MSLELLGDKYVKALTEAMTPSGVITEEYLDGLERLRARLALSQEDAKTLLGVAARARLGPVVKVRVWFLLLFADVSDPFFHHFSAHFVHVLTPLRLPRPLFSPVFVPRVDPLTVTPRPGRGRTWWMCGSLTPTPRSAPTSRCARSSPYIGPI